MVKTKRHAKLNRDVRLFANDIFCLEKHEETLRLLLKICIVFSHCTNGYGIKNQDDDDDGHSRTSEAVIYYRSLACFVVSPSTLSVVYASNQIVIS
jgi:hypothetical protein